MSKERGVRLATSGNRADTAGCRRYAVLTLRLLRFSGDGSLVLLLAATVAVSALIEATEPKPRGFLSRENACSQKYAKSLLATIGRVPRVPSRPACHASTSAPSNPPIWTALPCVIEILSQGVTRFGLDTLSPPYRWSVSRIQK